MIAALVRRWQRFYWRDDRGVVGGVEAIPFGLLLFVAGTLLVANAWAVIDAKMAATSAAREAARTYMKNFSFAKNFAIMTPTTATGPRVFFARVQNVSG